MKNTILKLAGVFFASLLVHSCQKDDLLVKAENSTLDQSRAMGYIPSTEDQLAQIKQLTRSSNTGKAALPSNYVLPELPAALNQAYKGSCVAYAIAHARTIISDESKTLANGNPNYEAYASGDYLYEKYKHSKNDCDYGVFFIDALDALKTEGTTSYADMGLVNCDILPTPSQEKNARKNRVNDYYRLSGSQNNVPTLEDIKRQIADGNPVIIGITVDYDFTSNSIRLWDKNTSKAYGGHAVVLTGYDNEKQGFRLLNSWGPSWGENGYIWVTYRKIEELLGPDVFVLQKDNLLKYAGASTAFVYLNKNINYKADNIDFLYNQMPSFINNGELNWNNNLVKSLYEQYTNPALVLSYYTYENEGINGDGDMTFEVRVRIEPTKNTSYPINTEKGIELELWNGGYGGKDQSISCNIPLQGTGKESVFKNNLGETFKYIVYPFLNHIPSNNAFEMDRTVRFHIKNGQFYIGDTYNGYVPKMPSGINRFRSFYFRILGGIGAVTDIRVYKNGKQIGIETFDGNITTTPIPWLQWFE